MSNTVYPYRYPFPRTAKWWTEDWREISEWCDDCIGPGEWEFYDSSFVFCREQDYMLFSLRWSNEQTKN
jgi:hypothetical protein